MGVHKLWDLLEPCGRCVNIEALTGKRLAIDASVWVYQFIKAMRDERGEMLRNAHLIGFFRRICKLLFHRVRPIFVFDGASPALKRQTIAARRRQREAQESRFRKAAERLLLSQLRQRLAHRLPGAVQESETALREAAQAPETTEEVQDRQASEDGGSAAGQGPSSSRPEPKDGSLSKRPPLPPRIVRARESAAVRQDALFASSSSDSEAEAALEVAVPEDGQIDPEVLSTLPPSMQLEVLMRLRERQVATNRAAFAEASALPSAFSDLQLRQYLRATAFRKRVEDLKDAMNEAASSAGPGARRIAGEEGREYVLVEGKRGRGGTQAGPSSSGAVARRRGRETENDRLLREGLERQEEIGERGGPKKASGGGKKALPGPERANPKPSAPIVRSAPPFGGEEASRTSQPGGLSQGEAKPAPAGDEATKPALMATQYSRGLLFGKEEAGGGLPFRAAEPVPVSTLDVVIDLDDLVGSGEDDVEWEDVDSRLEEGGEPTSLHLFPSDLSRDASNSAAAVPGAAENLGLREQPDLHWRERANRRQKFWSMSHGFQMGRKLGDWGRDEHSRDPESSQEPPEAAETEDAQVQRAIELSLREEGTGHGADEKGKREIFPALERSRAVAARAREPMDGAVVVESREDASVPRPAPSAQTAPPLSAPSLGAPPPVDPLPPPAASAPRGALAARINASSASALEEKIGPRPEDEMGERGLSLKAEKILDTLSRVEEAEGAGAGEQDEVQLSEDDEDEEKWKAPVARPLTAASSRDKEEEAAPFESAAAPELAAPFESAAPSEPAAPSDSAAAAESAAGSVVDISPDPEEREDESASPSLDASTPSPSRSSLPTGSGRDVALAVETLPPEEWEAAVQMMQEALEEAEEEAGLPGLDDAASEGTTERSERLETTGAAPPARPFAEPQPDRDLFQAHESLAAAVGAQSLKDARRAAAAGSDAPSEEMYGEIQELLALMGVPWLVAAGEAEAQCAWLNAVGLVDGVVTDDNDALVFGAPRVYRHIFSAGQYAEEYRAADVQEELGLGREELATLAQLLGSDYAAGVRGVGIVNAMEIVLAFPGGVRGLERFKAWTLAPDDALQQLVQGLRGRSGDAGGGTLAADPPAESLNLPPPASPNLPPPASPKEAEFRAKHRGVRGNWEFPAGFPSAAIAQAYLEPRVDSSRERFVAGKPDAEALRAFAAARFGWDRAAVDAALLPALGALEERMAQTTLHGFLTFSKRFAKIRSARLARAVGGVARDGARAVLLEEASRQPEEAQEMAAPGRAALPAAGRGRGRLRKRKAGSEQA